MLPALTVPTDPQKGSKKRRFPLAFISIGIAILGAIIYLVYANTQANAVYYMTVAEVKACQDCVNQSVRVSGYVQEGTIQHDETKNTVSFMIEDGGQTLPVVYSGVLPDTFQDGAQVVVEGPYIVGEPFKALTLLAKCPSKFVTEETE